MNLGFDDSYTANDPLFDTNILYAWTVPSLLAALALAVLALRIKNRRLAGGMYILPVM